jgi:hypothetical protein
MSAPSSKVTLTGLLADVRLLVILFVALRLSLLIAYQPLQVGGGERGVTTGGDFATYHAIAGLSATAGLPFDGWWSEFPPVWSFTTVVLYALSSGVYASFAMLMSVLILVFDVGNLLLIRRIGTHLHGTNTGMALAWIYAVLAAPLIFSFWNFEVVVAFWLLLGLSFLLGKKPGSSAVAAALGALIKFTPALLLGAAWRFLDRGRAVRYTLIVLGLFVLVYIPLFINDTSMTLPSLTAQFSKASYQTVWALLDGNFRTGNFGPVADRLDPARAADTLGNPAVVPGFVRLGVALIAGLFVFLRARRLDDKGLLAFVTITLLIFFLQAQGWSPQWLAQIIPLLLLCFPDRNGILIAVMLTVLTFVEYPLLFLRTGDTGGAISGSLVMPFALLVIARTAILVGICVALYRRLREEPVSST